MMNCAQNNDRRLLKAYESLESGEIEFLSLDIFDTLVWRKLPSPEDVFLLLGSHLKEDGWLIPAVTGECFAELRMAAEKAARRENAFTQNTEEVTLSEIYWRLQSIFVKASLDQIAYGNTKGIYESDVSSVIKKELALEKRLIQVDFNLLKLFSFARQKKIKVLLTSDTYFDEPQIKDLLESHLPLKEVHVIFASCEFGFSKKHGLFKQIVQELQTCPDKILHIGDSEERDILPAKELGIRTLHYFKQDDKLEEIFEREWPDDLSKRQCFLDRSEGDYGMTALRAKISQHRELETLKPQDRFFWSYGATVLGPVLLGFIHWIFERCREMKVDAVYCLMREGRLYAQLIRLYAPFYKRHAIEPKELWVSRLFITHASLSKASKNELMGVMKSFLEHFSVEQFCNYLGLELKSMPRWDKQRHVILEEDFLRQRLINDLVGNKSIVASAAAKRKRFLNYLSTIMCLKEPSPKVLVDVGWNGSAQSALHEIFKLAGSPLTFHGLYLGTTQTTHASLLRGNVSEGFLVKGGYPYNGNAHKKGCFVLEQTATAATGVGPLADITDEGSILTYPFLIPEKQKNQVLLIQRGIFAFFKIACEAVERKALNLDAHSETLVNQLRSIFLRSMLKPTPREARKFGLWLHEHGPSRQLTQVIGKNSYYDTYIKDMLPLAAFKESQLNWPAAYTAKQSKYLTLTSEAMWLKTLPPECFLSHDWYPLKIFLDTGKKFPAKATQTLELRSNPNRQFYALTKLFSTKRPIERIQILLAFPPAIVRMRSLRLVVYDKNNPEPSNLTFFENEKGHQADFLSGESLAFNTFICDSPFKIIYSFSHTKIYQIHLKLCCEMFQLKKVS
jgi:FMN phosphatase YigB (HAD superfamily)